MKNLFVIYFLFIGYQLNAQILTGLSARFNDAFMDWEVYSEDEDEKGNITMTWQNPDDWSQWTYRFGEKSGVIKTKWNKDFSFWEIRGDNKIITAQMIFNGDSRQWRITDNVISLELKCRWGNQLTEWLVDDSQNGRLYMYQDIQNDPRDWNIEDELDEAVSFPMKLTVVFLTMFNSVPK